jgi:hypothetical protein
MFIVGASYARSQFVLDGFSVFRVDEIPIRAVIADETTGLLADVEQLLGRVAREFERHLGVMLVAEYAKVLCRKGTQPFRSQLAVRSGDCQYRGTDLYLRSQMVAQFMVQ